MTTKLPSRLRRLDDALADLPLDEPMLLTELDGYLTGVAVSPEPIRPGEWLPIIWGGNEAPAPFDDAADVQWFTDAVLARYNEIIRDLKRGKARPIYDVDERNGDVLWEMWIDGFADALAMRPNDWVLDDDGGEGQTGDMPNLSTLIAIARNESDLDSVQINALQDLAPRAISMHIARLYASRPVGSAGWHETLEMPKVGRNEACPCGSGRKSKRCCGVS